MSQQQPRYYRLAQLVGHPGSSRCKAQTGMFPFSDSTLWRMVKAGKFPKPVKLSGGVTAWPAADVDAWHQSRESVAA
jgi:prophage regulatory protein